APRRPRKTPVDSRSEPAVYFAPVTRQPERHTTRLSRLARPLRSSPRRSPVERFATLAPLPRARALAALAASLLALLWAYWTTLAETARQWASDPQYSH